MIDDGMTLSFPLAGDAQTVQTGFVVNLGHDEACTVLTELGRDERVKPLIADTPRWETKFILGGVASVVGSNRWPVQATGKAQRKHEPHHQPHASHGGGSRPLFERLTLGNVSTEG